jgi:hypothetical protein
MGGLPIRGEWVAPDGAARTLLSYECRTKATDPSAAQLRTVESTLEEASRNG